MSTSFPNGWKIVPLPEAVFFQEGPGLRSTQFRDSGIPFLNIRTFKDGRIDRSLCKFLATDEVNSKYQHFLLHENDIVCSTSGTIGKLAKITAEDLPLMLNTSVIRFRPLDENQLERGWILLFLQTRYFLDQAMSAATGSAQVNVGPSHLKQMLFVLPPLDEQRRIVAEIEKQFTRLDAGVAALQRVRSKLRKYRASVLKSACEGRLVPTEAELARQENRDYESADQLLQRILTERRAKWNGRGKYSEPAPPSTPSLPDLPEGWVWASLEQLAWSSSYGTSAKCSYENSGPPVLRIPNIAAGRIDLSDLKFAGSTERIGEGGELLPGDLLIIRTNGSKSLIGRSAVVQQEFERPTGYASYLIRFRLIPEPILFAWIAAIWNSGFLRAWVEQRAATSAGQHNISMTVLNDLPIPLPPLAEQERIVAEVERRLSVVDELEATVTANLKRAARLRQAILQQAFKTSKTV